MCLVQILCTSWNGKMLLARWPNCILIKFFIPSRLPKRNYRSYLLQRFSIDYTIVWDISYQFWSQPFVIPQWLYDLAYYHLTKAKCVWGDKRLGDNMLFAMLCNLFIMHRGIIFYVAGIDNLLCFSYDTLNTYLLTMRMDILYRHPILVFRDGGRTECNSNTVTLYAGVSRLPIIQ